MDRPIVTVAELLLPGSESRVSVADAGLRAQALAAGQAVLVKGALAVRVEVLEAGDGFLRVRALERVTPDGQAVVEHGFGPAAERRVLKLRAQFPSLEANDAGRFADLAAAALQLPTDAMLAELDVSARLSQIEEAVTRRGEADRALRRIDILRQRKREILTELGEDETEAAEVLRERIAAAHLPPEVEVVAKKQATRLAGMGEASPEHSVTLNYLEWLLELPWDKRTPDVTDVAAARAILEADHHGLDKRHRFWHRPRLCGCRHECDDERPRRSE